MSAGASGTASASGTSASRRIGSGWTWVSRSSRRRSSRMVGSVRSCGSTAPVSYGSAPTEAITPCRSRATPSGPTNFSTASQTAGSSSSTRTPSRQPLAVDPPRVGDRLGQRQVEDVVRTPRIERRALILVHNVVRGRDEIGQRAGRAGVADGAKRLDVAHRGERTNGLAPYSRDVTTIAELVEDRTVEGVFAVARKERRRTRAGASYLALELVDPSGRVEARVWNDVDLLDQRFDEGDAVRVLGRVERFGGRLQVQVRTVEAAEDTDPSALTPSLRRDADELDGFFEFLASEISHAGPRRSRRLVRSRRRRPEGAPLAAGRLRRRSSRLCRWPPRAFGGRGHALPRDGAAPSAAASRHRARRCAPARRRPDPRARARAGVPADGRRAPARPRPSRPADDRGARTRPRSGGSRRAAARGCVSPRPPCRANRRGGRALPREPARRTSCDTPLSATTESARLAARAPPGFCAGRRARLGRRRLSGRARGATPGGAHRARGLTGRRPGRRACVGDPLG